MIHPVKSFDKTYAGKSSCIGTLLWNFADRIPTGQSVARRFSRFPRQLVRILRLEQHVIIISYPMVYYYCNVASYNFTCPDVLIALPRYSYIVRSGSPTYMHVDVTLLCFHPFT